MNAINPDRPEFTAAIRGYDRLQVDEYIERLQELVSEAENRARTAESELEFSRHSTVGPRVTEIFELAIAETKELREKTTADCDQARAEAQAEAERFVTVAREKASEIKEQAESEREKVLTALQAERRRAELEIEQLGETKKTMLAELRRLQQALAEAAGIYGEAGVDEPAEADTAEVEAGKAKDAHGKSRSRAA
jgi:hypothetical protein